MTTRVLGRVAPLYKGNYSNSTNYIKFDVAFDGESSFISKQGTAEAPNVGNALTDEVWWGLLCKGNYLAIQPLTDRVTELEADLSEKYAYLLSGYRNMLFNNLYQIDINVASGNYIYNDGTLSPLANGNISGPIEVKRGEFIILKGAGGTSGYSANVASISLTDSSATFYKPVVLRYSSGDLDYQDQPYSHYYVEEDGYIAVCWIGLISEGLVYKTKVDVINQLFNQTTSLISNSLGLDSEKSASQQLLTKNLQTITTTLYDRYGKIVNSNSVIAANAVFLKKDGSLGYSAVDHCISGYFIVKGLPSIIYKGYVTVNSIDVAIIVFYDKDKKPISSLYTIAPSNATGADGEYTTVIQDLTINVPSSAVYARCTSLSNYGLQITTGSNYILHNFIQDYIVNLADKNTLGYESLGSIPQYKSNLISLINGKLVEIAITTSIAGRFIDVRNGTLATLSTGNISVPIQVKKGEFISFIGEGGGSGGTPLLASISLTDETATFYKPVVGRNSYSAYDNCYSHYYVEEDGYIAVCWLNGTISPKLYKSTSDFANQLDTSIKLNKKKIDNIDIVSKEDFHHFFENIICIGDSVTAGHVYDYPRTPLNTGKVVSSVSYPSRLSKMTNWVIENAALAGITTLNWWLNYYPNYTYTNYQLALIELGYNGGLSDTLAVDVEPYSDYNDYANTNTGAYCKIIEAIKEANPNIYIIIIIPSTWTPTNPNRIVLEKIIARYELPSINLNDATFVNLSDIKFHGFKTETVIDYVHFNSIGYLAKAKFIKYAIGNIILQNAKIINDAQPAFV